MSTTRIEEYVETIYEICQSKEVAKVSDIKNALELSSLASVTEMVQKLAEEGLINYQKYRGVSLTEKGIAMAKELIKKHKNIEKFLKIIGVDENLAANDACLIEHIISEETSFAIKNFIDFMNKEENTEIIKKLKARLTAEKNKNKR